MIDLSKATVRYAFSFPLNGLPSKSLWQGGDVAVDPRDKKPYLFQMQAKATGPGDIEDTNIHRCSLTEKNGLLTKATYIDTAIYKGFGHNQTLHTRISVKGNPYHWLGLETYNAKHQAVGTSLYRVRHARGIIQRSEAQQVFTGTGSVAPISCPDWVVVLRRPSADTELYEWFRETALLARTAKDVGRPLPYKSIRVPRGTTTYQTSAASPTDGEFVRLNGATENASLLTAFSSEWKSVLNVTSASPPDVKVTSEEPEITFWYKGVLYFGKRFNSPEHRVVAYFSVV